MDLFSTTLQIWAPGRAARRYQDILLSYDLNASSLRFRQYPELVADSSSFVFFTLPLSAARLLSSTAGDTSPHVISIMAQRSVNAVPSIDETYSSQQEELATLQMCCPLIDCSIPESSRIDLLPINPSINGGNVELLLDLLDNTAKATVKTEPESDQDKDYVQDLLQWGCVREHNEIVSMKENAISTNQTSTEQSPWLSSKDDQQTVLTALTQITQDEKTIHGEVINAHPKLPSNDQDHVSRWNSFAESNGAKPRISTAINRSFASNDRQTPACYIKRSSVPSNNTGGYLTDRRRDFRVIEDHDSSGRGGKIARRNNRHQPKTATHCTAQDSYVQPYFQQDSAMAKHGSVW